MNTIRQTFEMLSRSAPAEMNALFRYGISPEPASIEGVGFVATHVGSSFKRKLEDAAPERSFFVGAGLGAGIHPLREPVTGEVTTCMLVCAIADDPSVLVARPTSGGETDFVLHHDFPISSPTVSAHAEEPEGPRNIIVAGAAGFIFRQVARLGSTPGYGGVRGNHRIFAVDRRPFESPSPEIVPLVLDVSSPAQVGEMFDNVERHLEKAGLPPVVHAVANGVALFSYTRPVDELFRANVLTTRALTQQCAKRGAFFVQMGAIAAQDNLPPPLKETDFPRPSEPYGFTKALAELEVFHAVRRLGLRAIIPRSTVVIGPGLGHSQQYARALFEQVRTPFVPLPSGWTSYVNSLDVARAVLFAIENPELVFGEPHELSDLVYNVCDREPMQDAEVFAHLMRRVPRERRIASAWFAPGPRVVYGAGFVLEQIARARSFFVGAHQEPKLARNLARLLKEDKVQDRRKFERVFEGNGFRMTYPSTLENLDAVLLDYYENVWHETPPSELKEACAAHAPPSGKRQALERKP